MHPYCVNYFGGSMVKNPPANAGDSGLIPGLGRSPAEGRSPPVFLPGKSHGQKNLEGYSPWGHKRVGHNLVTKQQHIIDIIWYLSFSFWFASLSVVIFGLHVVFCIWLLWLGIVFPMFTYAACSRQTLVLPLFGWMIFLNSLFFSLMNIITLLQCSEDGRLLHEDIFSLFA